MIKYRKTLIVMAIILVAIAIVFVYWNFDPESYHFFPKCPSKLITGYDCPGCGSQRALHALLNGDIEKALHYNALLFIALPFLAIYSVATIFSKRFPKLNKICNSAATAWISLIILILWWIIRNIYNQ